MTRRGLLGAVATILLGSQAGCGAIARPSPELGAARVALERARSSPLADRAHADLTAADAAMMEAEHDARVAPDSQRARDSAYVAQRTAEKARLAALYRADVEALEVVKRSVSQLRKNVPRKALADEERARLVTDERLARDKLKARFRAGLDRARGGDGQVVERADGATVLRFDDSAFFYPGSSMLRYASEGRLAAVALAIRSGSARTVRVNVLTDQEGWHADGKLVASRRVMRLRHALVGHGVPVEAFAPQEKRLLPGTQIDFVLVEEAVPVWPTEIAASAAPPLRDP